MRTTPILLAALILTSAPAAMAQPDGGKKAAPSAAPGGAPAAGEAVVIKPALAKGKSWSYALHLERSVVNAALNANPGSSLVVDAEVTLTCADASETGASVELAVGKVTGHGTVVNTDYTYDSTKPIDDKDRDNVLLQALKPVAGMKYTLVLDASGQVTKVEGDAPAPGGSFGPDVVQAFTNKDAVAIRWTNFLTARRGHAPTKVGETWQHTDTINSPPVGKFETTWRHALKSVKDGAASIDSTADLKLTPADPNGKMLFEVKEQSIIATSTWDLADGLPKTYESQRRVTLEGDAQGFKVNRKSEEKVTLTRK